MRIYLGQVDTTVGDLEGNARKVLAGMDAARGAKADLAVFPELTLTGYPPRDLLDRPSFVRDAGAALERVAAEARGIAAIVGSVAPNGTGSGNALFNVAALCADGRIAATFPKMLLPTYDVFDEDRHFEPAREAGTAALSGVALGISICEDAWTDPAFFGRRLYSADPIAQQVAKGSDLLVNISASPFALGRPAYRETLFAEHAARHRRPIVYVNLVGGNDELLFDGRSFVIDASGRLVATLAAFREDWAVVDVAPGPSGTASVAMQAGRAADAASSDSVVDRAIDATRSRVPAPSRNRDPVPTAGQDEDAAESYEALVMGLRDYAVKCGFTRTVVGLSGGIDSAVVAALAAAALGSEGVVGVSMPSRYSSKGSVEDAAALAANLGIRTISLPIDPLFTAYLDRLSGVLEGGNRAIAEENVQARIRGNLLMALSNAFGWLVLTTGNKSEMAVGYCTLYGDMSGGLAVLADVPKTLVYRIARRINRDRAIIPQAIFEKPPSAELRPNQTDQDTLPPYDVLDGILKLYVEEVRPIDEIIAAGYEPAVVRDVVRRVARSEYKRRQAPPGLRITTKAFGLGRRMPIAQRYDG